MKSKILFKKKQKQEKKRWKLRGDLSSNIKFDIWQKKIGVCGVDLGSYI